MAVVPVADLRDAIGFSWFAALVHYAVANASAWTLGVGGHRWPRWLAGAGVVSCLGLALSLPAVSVAGGIAVLALGVAARLVARRAAPGGE